MSRRIRPLLFPALLWMAAMAPSGAQTTLAPRYYITPRPGTQISHADLVRTVAAIAVPDPNNPNARSGVLAAVDFPQFGFNGVAARLTPVQFAELGTNRFRILLDVPLLPNGGPAGPDWALNQFSLPGTSSLCQAAPAVYLVDTGIASAHPDFTGPPVPSVLSFQPGLSYGYNLAVDPALPLPPYQDAHDHGTRMAGCLGGVSHGLLGALGGRAQVHSVVIYDAPSTGPLNTFVSQAIGGILGSVADHQARLAQPYLKNHASVLIFAHSTTAAAGRFGDLDRAIEIAWESGLHVVMSAGNEGAAAVLVSPAGAAWSYSLGGPPVRFWFGAPPTGATFHRAAAEFLVAGAYQIKPDNSLLLWPGSNTNLPAAEVLDGFAPGVAVPAPSLLPVPGLTTGTGTSYSAALVGALATWTAGQKPWASPAEVRGWLRGARVPLPGGLRFDTPALPDITFTYERWIHHFLPLPVLPAGADDPMADPDGDGVANFVEYYCGMDPRFPDAHLRPVLSATVTGSGADLRILLPRACWLGETPPVAWTLQHSTDLLAWTPVTLTTFAPEGTPPAGDAAPWVGTATVSPRTERAYFRLRFHATGPL